MGTSETAQPPTPDPPPVGTGRGPREPDPSAVLTAALAEFGKLRDEISGRSTALWALLGLNATISSAVAGFVLAQQADPLILLLLPLLTPSLGLLLIDHATNIGNIGNYIDTVLRPLIVWATGESRLFRYEEFVDQWETKPLRRILAFGVPLVLLFNVTPVYALVYTWSVEKDEWTWGLWGLGLAITLFQLAIWVAWLAPPLRQAIRSSTS